MLPTIRPSDQLTYQSNEALVGKANPELKKSQLEKKKTYSKTKEYEQVVSVFCARKQPKKRKSHLKLLWINHLRHGLDIRTSADFKLAHMTNMSMDKHAKLCLLK